MTDIDKLGEVETETYEDRAVYNFESGEYSWEEIYELGVELDADVIGRKDSLDGEISGYFISLTY